MAAAECQPPAAHGGWNDGWQRRGNSRRMGSWGVDGRRAWALLVVVGSSDSNLLSPHHHLCLWDASGPGAQHDPASVGTGVEKPQL